MARLAVTYEQVAAVANQLYAQGDRDPGAKAIRAELAKRAGPGATTGSPNTIQRHLIAWRSSDRPVEAKESPPQLPPQLAGEIGRALNAAAAVAREIGEERLAVLQAELNELVAIGEVAEARNDELAQDMVARTSERDSMAGLLGERTAELHATRAELKKHAERAAQAERELSAALADTRASKGLVDEIRASTDTQLHRLQTELDQVRAAAAEAAACASQAEKRTAAAEARLEGEQAARAALQQQVEELRRVQPVASQALAAQAEALGLREQVRLLNETLSLLRSMLAPPPGDVSHASAMIVTKPSPTTEA